MGRLWSFLGPSFEAFLERVESVKGRLEALLSRRLIVCDTPLGEDAGWQR